MAVPAYHEFYRSILELAAGGGELELGAVITELADRLELSETDREARLPSGVQTELRNRVSWAITYLSKAALVERTGRGRFRITPRGLQTLADTEGPIDNTYLSRFPEYVAFRQTRGTRARRNDAPARADSTSEERGTPQERLEAAFEEIRTTVVSDLIERILDLEPRAFESLVIRTLTALGYGQGDEGRAEVTGRSGDDGIDGVIHEDRLGLDVVYMQAKKWATSPVGPGEIDQFFGSLMRQNATKGVFITSNRFTDGARRAAMQAKVKIRLIDGEELAELMIDHGVGVNTTRTLNLVKIDADFFDELG